MSGTKTESGVQLDMKPLPGAEGYYVCVRFSVDNARVEGSQWENPLRVALEVAEEALNELKCAVYNEELNAGKPYEKPKFPVEPSEEKKP